MSGVKTNERPGTRAQVKHVRSSAYKAREVLNLIRHKSFQEASDLLMFSERRISDTVQKCLNSAAANAENNDGISSEELYVTACYADEGPTMKRWRPRARGRATRIRKRTCHITIILARYTPDELEEMRNRAELKGASLGPSAAEARRRRVEKSKEVANDTESEAAQDLDEEVQEQGSSEERQEFADEGQENDEEQESSEENDESSPYGAGSAPAGDDGSQPSEDYQIKGKVSSKIYHPPESPFFSRTKADVWFTTSEVAEKAGFSLPASMQDSNEDDQPSSKNENEETGEDNETEEGE
ncbi:MAG: 50S ribosomal protein L22 [Acidimicrobiaceae bacterium]|jgi:large subunit ribosomal protein L22|nr:50S ribosomal protein L22 [Acidimicrobiaceae bacterium]|tara:strand:- start:8697 stop:9593 length:897 start_codon:yes stop_codon:yes gene_type:complete